MNMMAYHRSDDITIDLMATAIWPPHLLDVNCNDQWFYKSITSIRWHLDPAQSSSFHQGSQLLCCTCNSLLCNHHHHQLTSLFD